MLDFSMRRSIRKYKNKPVNIEVIKDILIDACYAPSSNNNQPWEFILILDKKIKKDIMEIHKYANMLLDTEYAILVCCDRKKTDENEFWVQDCSAATENMLLSATKHGLGSVWLGVYSNEKRMENISKIVRLPSNIIPFALVVIGYADSPICRKRIKPKKVCINTYNSEEKILLKGSSEV